jgi:cytochrome c5
MKRKAILFALVVGTALAPLAQAKTPAALKSVSVTFPQSTRTLPDGPGVATAQGNCLTCHSAGMIMTQPRMPKAAWAAEVTKMRNVYKAPVDEKDVPAIVDYLTAIKGPK